MGRFEAQKNHSFLIDIFKEYHEINLKSLLLLIGQRKLEGSIIKKVLKLGLEKYVKFLGVRFDVSELMQAMDIFILPSHYEGLGVVAIEAQAAGLPTLVSDKVPKEAKVTELINFQNIDDNASEWVKTIEKYKQTPKRNMYANIL